MNNLATPTNIMANSVGKNQNDSSQKSSFFTTKITNTSLIKEHRSPEIPEDEESNSSANSNSDSSSSSGDSSESGDTIISDGGRIISNKSQSKKSRKRNSRQDLNRTDSMAKSTNKFNKIIRQKQVKTNF